ncbi:DUF927 domain-containing protein [Pararoseomonas indoligenes]|uniref:DUF927 domain-containing protein n=1 Tax=Roseomonas indoligenes TaxID=2820811 RepID=A0A940MZY9_9PROT|nr:DUF927 domain-containing protein [Pararoseomonas indoligenes]MBP0493989.1 DUF927 domain-containing protein [Pararoseomonas indoligenes]
MDARMDEDTAFQGFASAASDASEESSNTSRADIALEVVRLTGLSEPDYQQQRKAAARDCGLSLAALDKLVRAERARRRREDATTTRRKAPPEPGEVRWPHGFDMERDGLYADQGEAGSVWLCAPLEVLGEGRDAAGEGWGLWLRWKDRDGRIHTWPMPARLLVTAPGELEAALLERGLRVSPNPAARMLLREALGGVQAGSRVTLVSRAGWHAVGTDEAAYILPDGAVIGATAETLVMKAPPENAVQMVAQAGTLDGWKVEVAAPAAGNPMAAFLLAAAFAGPLLDACGEPSGGFHITGRSKVGKTLALRLALSVWGPPVKGAMLRDWRSTANGLEGAAEEAGDGVLGLDELHQADPREVASACYMLANESGKGRMRRDTTAQRRRTWRTFILSTGELDIATVVSRTGQSLPAGAEVRLPSISVDGGTSWPALHGRATLGELMTDLHAAVRRHHGHAARAFVAKLAEVRRDDAAGLSEAAIAMRERVLAILPADADPQVRDVARRCALVALAGELATLWDILPWPEDEAFRAAAAMLARWVEKRGGGGATEETQHVRAVRLFLTEHGASRFVGIHFERGLNSSGWVESHPERPVIKRAGWRRRQADGRDEYLISPEVWRELCREAGVDPTEAARTLRAEGFLSAGEDKNLARRETIPGVGRPRVYVIKADLIGDPETAKGSLP